ncbi:MAG: sodium:proton antiporter [Leptolyngbya sp. PLA1]|nr:sodium:proton antiporter [Leptolyngbya sp. PLA1]
MSLTKPLVTEALRAVPGAAAGTDLVSGQHLLWVSACDSYASIKLQYPAPDKAAFDAIAARAHTAVLNAARPLGTRVDSFIVEFVNEAGAVVHTSRFGGTTGKPQPEAPSPPQAGHTPIPGLRPQAPGLPGVGRVIAVGAGKGGVGKSTVAVNLAVGLARLGQSVGLLDADIYGPSIPTMLGLDDQEVIVHDGLLQPFLAHGVRCMTMGKLVPADKPLIWRGPMAHGAFKQLTEQTRWGELDTLVIDLPPGTGDVALTMAQMLRLTGAIVVCTPQRVAQDDASRAIQMFRQLGVELLGVVENMSTFVGDDGKEYDIFGRGGAQHMAQRLGVPFLGAIPITMSLRQNSDSGDPTRNFTGTGRAERVLAEALAELVRQVEAQVALASLKHAQTTPKLTFS